MDDNRMDSRDSRNDQVATDMRMWLRDELRKIEKYLMDFLKASVGRAEQDISLLMPGFVVDWKLDCMLKIDVESVIRIFRRRSLFVGVIGCCPIVRLLLLT